MLLNGIFVNVSADAFVRSSPGFVVSNNYMYVPSDNIIGIQLNHLHTVSDAIKFVSNQ